MTVKNDNKIIGSIVEPSIIPPLCKGLFHYLEIRDRNDEILYTIEAKLAN